MEVIDIWFFWCEVSSLVEVKESYTKGTAVHKGIINSWTVAECE